MDSDSSPDIVLGDLAIDFANLRLEASLLPEG
jgi:hypothetical protein